MDRSYVVMLLDRSFVEVMDSSYVIRQKFCRSYGSDKLNLDHLII